MASNCIITSGLALASCVNNVPGIDELFVLTSTGTSTDAQFASITYDVDGYITSFSAATTGLTFQQIDLVRNSSAALNEETSINLPSLGFTFLTKLLFTIPGYSQENTNLYQQIVKNTQSYFIVKLKTGKYFLAGADVNGGGGMYVETAGIVSGSLPGDDQLYSIGLTSQSSISVPEMLVSTTLTAFVAGSGFGLYYNN
jgi:hypothetical protein